MISSIAWQFTDLRNQVSQLLLSNKQTSFYFLKCRPVYVFVMKSVSSWNF